MDILVIGSGAREHVICRKLLESSQVRDVYCLPGNYGMTNDGIKLVDINMFDFTNIIKFVQNNGISYTVVGPENILVEGIVDEFKRNNQLIFGPSKRASQLEGSKEFAKKIMIDANIPTANFVTFFDSDIALEYLSKVEYPIVIKKDGLASGKGVVIADDIEEAKKTCLDFLNKPDSEIIIEEYLEGEEFSAMYFVQGLNIYPMPFSQDYKRAFDNGKGPNTGGMGAYAPLPHMNLKDRSESDEIINSVLLEMKQQGIDFTGILYAGLIKTMSGVKVIEFNVRFGDPETEVVLPLLESDLAVNISEIIHEKEPNFVWREDYFNVGVVCATKGYPDDSSITELESFIKSRQSKVFYSNLNKKMLTTGRSFVMVSSESTIDEARKIAYAEIPKLNKFFYRKDIGK